MKALLCAAALGFLVSTPGLGADAVSLVGTWTGQRDRIAKIEGRRGGLATLVITEQQGNTFAGRLKRSNPTGDEEEPLSSSRAPYLARLSSVQHASQPWLTGRNPRFLSEIHHLGWND